MVFCVCVWVCVGRVGESGVANLKTLDTMVALLELCAEACDLAVGGVRHLSGGGVFVQGKKKKKKRKNFVCV